MNESHGLAGWIRPDWPAPDAVRAACTTRTGGCSEGPWASLNLGERCGDAPDHVRRNRERLLAHLPAPPQWLRQVHGVTVARHPGSAGAPEGDAPEADAPEGDAPEADALVAFGRNQVCAVLTADCLPVLFCDRAGSRVAVAHAGWRGLAGGVLAATVRALQTEPGKLLAWLGPAIGPAVYEVGAEVAAAFRGPLRDDFAGCFTAVATAAGERWLLDLYAVARLQLAAAGVGGVSGGGLCTYSDPARFFSHRRDGVSGRMASLIWLA